MFSKEDSKQLRQEFWTSFGRNHPRKWLLYNTRIKDLALKFYFTTSCCGVTLDLESRDEILRAYYWEKLEALSVILCRDYIPDAVFEKEHWYDESKVISRIFVEKSGVSIHRKKDWPYVQQWLFDKMDRLEKFFMDYKDYLEA